MLLLAEISMYWESDLSKCCFAHYRRHMDRPEIEVQSPKPVAGRLQHEQEHRHAASCMSNKNVKMK